MGNAVEINGFNAVLIAFLLAAGSLLMASIYLLTMIGRYYQKRDNLFRNKFFGHFLGALTCATLSFLMLELLSSQPCLSADKQIQTGQLSTAPCNTLTAFLDQWILVWGFAIVGAGVVVSRYYLPFLRWWHHQK